jgi:hypothetical protein
MYLRLMVSLTTAVSWGLLPDAGSAQANASHRHIGHVIEAFAAAPDGAGLLATAEAETAIALRHAQLALRDPTDIDAMKQHSRHVLNTMDPAEFTAGPGLGFGVKAAAAGIVQHIELAATSEGASPNVKTHAAHVSAAAGSVAQRVTEIVELAEQVLTTSDYNRAFGMVERLRRLCQQLTAGLDVSGDGSISLDEGGLQHARQHMELMAQGEGLD